MYWFPGNKGLACFDNLSVHIFICPSRTAQVCKVLTASNGLSVNGDWSFLSGVEFARRLLVFVMLISSPVVVVTLQRLSIFDWMC